MGVSSTRVGLNGRRLEPLFRGLAGLHRDPGLPGLPELVGHPGPDSPARQPAVGSRFSARDVVVLVLQATVLLLAGRENTVHNNIGGLRNGIGRCTSAFARAGRVTGGATP